MHENALLVALALAPSGAMAQAGADTAIYKNVRLDSVVVTGSRPLVTHHGTADIVNVRGSYLSGMGSLGDMLAVTPGLVVVGQNEFNVVGKGAPKFYVDGREVTQQDIFSTIKSVNVARVEIEREPSAKYPSGTVAVVNVVTVKPLADYVSLNLYNTLSVRRKVSEQPSFDFTYSRGKWASSVSYGYGTTGNLNRETYFVEIYRPDYTFRSDETNRSYVRSRSHDITWSNDFRISDIHRLGFVYSFKHSDDNTLDNEHTAYCHRDYTEQKDIVRRDFDRRNMHNISLSYQGDLTDDSSIELSADYSIIDTKERYTSDEANLNTQGKSDVYTRSDGKYSIITLNGAYSFELPGGISTEIGGRYYNTYHPLDYATNNRFATSTANHQVMRDNVGAGYFSLRRSWKKFSLSVGGRYEYSGTRIRISGGDSYSAARHTSDFLPSATVQWAAAKRLVLRGVYMRSVGRQGYQGLNPSPTYRDSLRYSAGSASLRPEYSDKCALYAFLGNDFVVGVSYVNRYDGIETVTYSPYADRNVVAEMPVNIHRSEHYQCMLMYSHSFGKLYFSGSAALTLPHDVYFFRDRRHSVTKPYWEGQFSLSYKFTPGTSAYTALSYQSFNRENFVAQRRVDNWTAGIRSNLLKDRLTLSLNVSDILHHANYNNVSECFGNTRNGTYGTNDMRGISLSATFRLFNKKLSTDASSNNDEVLERTE